MAKFVTPANFVEVVNTVKGRSRREVEEFTARVQNKPRIAEKIKLVAISKNISKTIKVNNQSLELFNVLVGENTTSVQSTDNLSVNQVQQGCLQQESANHTAARNSNSKELRYELCFSVSSEVLDEIGEAKVIFSGKFPGGVKLEDVLSAALGIFLEKKSIKRRKDKRERNKEADKKEHPADNAVAKAKTRYIPVRTRAVVLDRDNYSCAFVSATGWCCGATHDLENHHVAPHAIGLRDWRRKYFRKSLN